MTIILAVDPGLTGALAIYATDAPDRVAVYDMPVIQTRINALELRDMIIQWKPDYAYIEQVGPMPRDGVRQAWRFSAAYTTAHVVIAMLGITHYFVSPAIWKHAMKVKGGGQEGKEKSRAMALQLFPSCAASFARKKDQGRAEAALLARYGSTQLL